MAIQAAQIRATISVDGATTAQRQLRDVGETAKATTGHFEGLKNALSFAGGQLIFGGLTRGFDLLKDQLGGIFQESMDAADELAQTNKVLQTTHDASGQTAQSILDLATKFSHLTKFTDDQVQVGENLLLTFTNIGKKTFPQATEALLNMSQAMGQDVKSSAVELGKALNDPVQGMSALQRIGVTFTDAQKTLIQHFMDTNQLAQAQGVILQELQREFGGSAVAAGKTFSGQLAILGQNLDDIKQTIGDALIPVVSDLLHKYITPLAQKFADWLTKGGGLKDFQNILTQIGNFMQYTVIPTFTTLLNQNVIPLAQWIYSLWQHAVDLFHAFQQGEGYANALAIGLGTIGSAIVAIKIEEFVAGWVNWFNELNSGAGFIANVASNALPELGQALGWTRTQAAATSTAIEGIGAASVEAEGVVAVSSAGMTLALGAATAGVSLLVGAVIAGITADAVRGQTAIGDTAKKVYDALGKTSDDMRAKAQADAAVAQVSWKTTSDNVTSRWQNTGQQVAKASSQAKAQFILDQQAMRDAAEKAAQAADDAWTKASQDMNIVALLQASGWTQAEIAKYLHQNISNTSGTTSASGTYKNYQGQTVTKISHVGAHAEGIINSPTSHMAIVGERGPELMFVPRGSSILPNSALTSGVGRPIIVQPPNIYLDGVRLSHGLMPYVASTIRAGTGAKF